MKKLLITLIIVFSIKLNAQKQFEGAWVSDTSSHTTIIIASDYAILKVFNFSTFLTSSVLFFINFKISLSILSNFFLIL